jgi:hypothetical protein
MIVELCYLTIKGYRCLWELIHMEYNLFSFGLQVKEDQDTWLVSAVDLGSDLSWIGNGGVELYSFFNRKVEYLSDNRFHTFYKVKPIAGNKTSVVIDDILIYLLHHT